LDGDKAGSESYCMAALRISKEDSMMQMMVWTHYQLIVRDSTASPRQ